MLFTYSTPPYKKHPKDTDIRIQDIQDIQSIRIHNHIHNQSRTFLKVFDGIRDLQHIMKSTRSGCSSCG
jgi:hypothetical protein